MTFSALPLQGEAGRGDIRIRLGLHRASLTDPPGLLSAPVERWFWITPAPTTDADLRHGLKNERVSRVTYLTREAARQAITHYIESWYNRKRFHSAAGCRLPREVHAAYEKLRVAA